MYFAFVDYENAFNSIEFKLTVHAFKNHGVNKVYPNTIKHLYHEAISVIHLRTVSMKFRLQRGGRQGDNISPRLFISCHQDAIIGKINWKNRSIKIDSEYLSHLIFADDIVMLNPPQSCKRWYKTSMKPANQ